MEHVTTNWEIVEGCLEESIYYDTSTDIDNLLEAQPLLLTKPDSCDADSPPCEISIYFRENHNIYRVYVRSAAQAYEIYLSSNQQTSSEYLCTVHCKAVREEVSKNQIHYEATTDISEVDPCLSLTVCFLSIQTSNHFYIDEIYVYADPIKTHDPYPSSVLAMLLSSLVKLSNPSTIQNKNSMKGKSVTQKASTSNAFNNVSDSYHEQSEVNYHPIDYNNQVCTRTEKLLNELITKVDRLETLCSKLQEKLLNPLDSMDMKIQQLEQKLDSLAIKSESCHECLCSTKNYTGSNVCDIKNKDGSTSDTKNEMSEKSDTQTGSLSFDDLSSLASADVSSSAFAYEEGSHMIVKSPKFITMFDSEDTSIVICPKHSIDLFEERDDDHFRENLLLDSDKYMEAIAESMEKEWDDVLCDEKFTQDRDWVTDLPLELLLTDISDTTLAEAVTK